LDRLAMFGSHHLETRSQIAANTTTPLMTGYMGSVIVIMMILMIPVISFEQFAVTFTDVLTGSDLNPHNDAATQHLLAELNLVLVVIGAFCSMFLISQIRYATVLHSLHTGILLLVISGMLYYDRFVGVGL